MTITGISDDIHSDGEACFLYNEFYSKYDPKEVLGRGLSSVVRRCIEKATKVEYAVKIIDLNNLDVNSEDLRNDARRELNILKMVQGQPNIVGLHDSYETDAYIFLVFEICKQGELFEYLNLVVCLSEKRTRLIMTQLLSAILFIHRQNIVHRDIKAENILLDDNLNVKLTDFGFAVEISDDNKLTDLCGTPSYLSPEILYVSMYENREGYGRPVDMWACGVLMYTLLCGSPPFWHRNQMKMLRQIMEGKFSFSSPEWEEVSESAKDLIQRMLCVDPNQRVTAAEALEHPFFKKQSTLEDKGAAPKMPFVREFDARTRFRASIWSVRCLIRIRKQYATPERMQMRVLREDPYANRTLRKLIDNTAFLIYNHWVKKAEDQNRAALFEITPKRDRKQTQIQQEQQAVTAGVSTRW